MKYGTFVDFGSIGVKSVKPMSVEETAEMAEGLFADMLLREKKEERKEARKEARKERKARRNARKAELSWRLWLFRQRLAKRR